MMRIQLDNSAFNRPFDSQNHIRIRLEKEAKLYIQNQVKLGNVELARSYILDFENSQNPFAERRSAIQTWRSFCALDVDETPSLLAKAEELLAFGIKSKDALHLAAAIAADADYFLTTDDRLLNKTPNITNIQLMNPMAFVKVLDDYDN